MVYFRNYIVQWLTFHDRSRYQTTVLVYTILHNLALEYMNKLIALRFDNKILRSI